MELDSKYDQSGGLEGGSLVDGGMEQWQGAVKAATGLLDRIWSLWWKQQCVNVYVVTSEVRWQRRYSPGVSETRSTNQWTTQLSQQADKSWLSFPIPKTISVKACWRAKVCHRIKWIDARRGEISQAISWKIILPPPMVEGLHWCAQLQPGIWVHPQTKNTQIVTAFGSSYRPASCWKIARRYLDGSTSSHKRSWLDYQHRHSRDIAVSLDSLCIRGPTWYAARPP